MSQQRREPFGFVTFTLHAHLPFVIHNGTWPHGMEWLHEAAAETYLPLLRMLGRLEQDGVHFRCNLNLTPVLLEQLSHPTFLTEFPRYLARKIVAAREDEAYFSQAGEGAYAETARFWSAFFSEALESFQALGGDLIARFRHFEQVGMLEVITCGATHGYLPLLGTDESVRAQVRLASATHKRHMGKAPKGIWIPECGYRPAGRWTYPVDEAKLGSFDRIGVEQALAEVGLEYFFVDTHLVEGGPRRSPYDTLLGTNEGETGDPETQPARSIYRPHFVAGSGGGQPLTIFPRDPRTGLQVWSGETGYPGDGAYLDFHKKRWPGGHRYWRVSGPRVEMGDKLPYHPASARDRVREHAEHFTHLLARTLDEAQIAGDDPPILSAPFDAELFGHWWFEGMAWLEAVARALDSSDLGVSTILASEYLERFSPAGSVVLPEGSWGAEGSHQVWMNPETGWTWGHLYPAEIFVREVATAGRWRQSDLGTRVVQQMCRELLLLESSDWQFLITTGAARDYAEMRFLTHHDQFNELRALWEQIDAGSTLSSMQERRLVEIEVRDSVFADLDPGLWAREGSSPAA